MKHWAEFLIVALWGWAVTTGHGQDPSVLPAASSESSPAIAPAAAATDSSPRQGQAGSRFLGGDVPIFDPGTEVITWDGRMWNVSNNRVFDARFERFLNQPEETSQEDLEYNRILREIMQLLSPQNYRAVRNAHPKIPSAALDAAFRLLPQASNYQRDALLSDAIANQVQAAWQAQRARERLEAANRALEEERKRLDWNTRMATQPLTLESSPPRNNPAALRQWEKDRQAERDARLVPLATRTAEVEALRKANELKKEISQLQAKVEFQALIVQLFLQRRFQHVLIATRFYRSIFAEGEGTLELGQDTKELFSRTTGMPPTVSTIDSMAGEVLRDVAEGIQAFHFLVDAGELDSASKRLAETYIVGEYLPEIRTLPRDKKRKVLSFVQKSNQLLSALEMKDYALAEKLTNELESMAKDFDASKPRAAIETARTVAAMHLAKARNAAVSGDRATMEAELREATAIWPRNPDLAEVSGFLLNQADVQQQALLDFDQLLSQKNYRQIFEDRARFIAATATYPERAAELEKVLEKMAQIEAAIVRAQEIERRGDAMGAWESVERAHLDFPQDSKLSGLRAELTTKAADFVRSLRTAQELESKGQLGSSLAWFLQAQQAYPPSDFAREGIDRIVPQIVPDDVSRR